MKECCGNCKFLSYSGICKRFPVGEIKQLDDYCGEFVAKSSLNEVDGEDAPKEQKKKILLND